MKIELWAVSRPIPYARNARKIPQKAIDKVAASIKEFGWKQPIVVDSEGVIVVGHTRLLAAQKLGLAEVPVLVASDLTPAQVKAYRLADNRVNQESSWDESLLAVEIGELSKMAVDLSAIGFDKEEMGAMVFAGWPEAEKKTKDSKMKLGGFEFRVLIDCDSEAHQAQLLEKFQAEGYKCRALIS